jgi:hypothetical protein
VEDLPTPASMISAGTMRAHRFRWFAYAGGERIPRVKTMRGQWGFDAVRSCGYDTKVGGGVESYIKTLIWNHRFDAQSVAVTQ